MCFSPLFPRYFHSANGRVCVLPLSWGRMTLLYKYWYLNFHLFPKFFVVFILFLFKLLCFQHLTYNISCSYYVSIFLAFWHVLCCQTLCTIPVDVCMRQQAQFFTFLNSLLLNKRENFFWWVWGLNRDKTQWTVLGKSESIFLGIKNCLELTYIRNLTD